MDHAHAWRSRPPMPPLPTLPPFTPPPPAVNICAVCSIPHFPFCPSPYPQTPRMPFHDQFYTRPPLPPQPPPQPPQAPYDPFVDHQPGTTMNPPRPWTANPNSNPSFDRDLYGYSNPSFDYAHAGSKRMRVDESVLAPGPASGWGPNLDASNRFSTADERRLKLIREHGGLNREFGKHLEGFGGGRNGFEAKSLNNYDTGNFRDPNYSSLDRKETVYSQESHYNSKKFSEDRFGQQYVHSDRTVELGILKYDQSNGYGCSGNPGDGYSNVEVNRRSSERVGYSSSMGDGHMGDWQGVSGGNAGYKDSRSGFGMENHKFSNPYSQSYGMQQQGVEPKPGHYGSPYVNEQGGGGVSRGRSQIPRVFNGQPPLPASPPPPLPVEPPGRQFLEPVVSTSPSGTSLFPIASAPVVPEAKSSPATYYSNKAHLNASSGFPSEGIHTMQQTSTKRYMGESEQFPPRHISPDKPKVLDASHLLKHPHRATRPDHIVIILRGLPGSGKSYLAKMLREFEVENGGSAPRIHTMDDYFMTEVEKVEESEGSKPSGSVRAKKPVTKKVMEYCYEPEMEEAYRSSMLKAFKKTLDEGVFSFVIVDDRNLRVADFAQFWATAKRSGYEVYLLEATYKDPAGCAARNIHGFTQDDIKKMADQWEEAPSLYLRLDIKSLLHGDNLEESGIQEVDMDTEDGDVIGVSSGLDDRNPERVKSPPIENLASNGPSKEYQRWDAEADRQNEEVKELGKSKWSNDLNEDDIHKTEVRERKLNALSGLIQSYSKEDKTVRWGDQVRNKGFSIGAAKSARASSSLVIGPGAGYNLKTNPLTEEDKLPSRQSTGGPKGQNIFQERLQAERESFRAVFDKRRHRIGGLDVDDE